MTKFRKTKDGKRENVIKVQKWRARHPNNYKQASKKYWLSIKNDSKKLQQVRERAREYYKKHRKERIESVQNFWKRNPEKRLYYRVRSNILNKRRMLKLRFLVFLRDNFTCQYCGRLIPTVELQIDHKIPIAVSRKKRSYRDITINSEDYITSCRECNMGKGDLILKMFEK